MPCRPNIVFPTSSFKQLDPSWASCSGQFAGVWDPPYALNPATGLGPMTPVSPLTSTSKPAFPTAVPQSLPTSTTQPTAMLLTKASAVDSSSLSLVKSIPTAGASSVIQSSSPAILPSPVQSLSSVARPVESGSSASQTPNGSSDIVIVAGHSITQGAPAVTVAGTPLSAGTNGIVVIATSTISPLAVAPVFTVGSETFTVYPTAIAIDGVTLTAGAPGIVVSGTPISLGASDLVIGSKTEAFVAPSSSSSAGLAAVIISGLGAVGGGSLPANQTPTGGNGTSVGPFLGTGARTMFAPSLLFGGAASGFAFFVLIL